MGRGFTHGNDLDGFDLFGFASSDHHTTKFPQRVWIELFSVEKWRDQTEVFDRVTSYYLRDYLSSTFGISKKPTQTKQTCIRTSCYRFILIMFVYFACNNKTINNRVIWSRNENIDYNSDKFHSYKLCTRISRRIQCKQNQEISNQVIPRVSLLGVILNWINDMLPLIFPGIDIGPYQIRLNKLLAVDQSLIRMITFPVSIGLRFVSLRLRTNHLGTSINKYHSSPPLKSAFSQRGDTDSTRW